MVWNGMTEKGLAWGAWVLVGALGCTVQTSSEGNELDAASEENVGEVSQAIEQTYDRPAAAAVGVGDGGIIRELWVFVCNSQNVLKRKRKSAWNGTWGNWETVTSTPCSGVPSAGAGQAAPNDDVEVFFRSTAGNLIEIYYKANGTIVERDLSTLHGLGPINGNPVITQMSTYGHYSVAYRRNPSNYVATLTYIPGTKPTSGFFAQHISADNGIGRSRGQLIAFYTPNQTYLAAGFTDVWRVYTRTSWSDPYVQVNEPMNFIWSVLTFTAPTPTTTTAVSRDSIGRVIKSPVVNGQPWSFDLGNVVRVEGTPSMGGSWNYDGARNWDMDRGAAACGSANIFGQHCALFGLNDSQAEIFNSTPGMRSAGTRPVNAGAQMDSYVFWTDSVNQLFVGDLSQPQDTVASNMGILTLPP